MARKRWVAELDLSGNSTISINGQEFGKQEIITTFDRLQKDEHLAYHLAVDNDGVMRHFLETGEFTKGQQFVALREYEDEAFIQWITPYVVPAFQKLLAKSFATGTAVHVAALCKQMFPPASIEAEAWQPACDYLRKATAFMEYFVESSFQEDRFQQMQKIISLGTMQLLCLKPVHLFSQDIDEYCRLLHKLSRELHKEKPEESVALLHNGSNLPMNDLLCNIFRMQIDFYHRYYGQTACPRQEEDENIPFAWYDPAPATVNKPLYHLRLEPAVTPVAEKKNIINILIVIIIALIAIILHLALTD